MPKCMVGMWGNPSVLGQTHCSRVSLKWKVALPSLGLHLSCLQGLGARRPPPLRLCGQAGRLQVRGARSRVVLWRVVSMVRGAVPPGALGCDVCRLHVRSWDKAL